MRTRTTSHTYLLLKDEYKKIRNEFVLIIAKCVSDETLIKGKNKELRIGSMEENKEYEILSWNFNKNKLELDRATRINSGKKEVFEMETESGKKIKTSIDHIFFNKIGDKIIEKALGDLKVGDYIITVEDFYEI